MAINLAKIALCAIICLSLISLVVSHDHDDDRKKHDGKKDDKKHGDCPYARAREFYSRHVQCRQCIRGIDRHDSHNNNVKMQWCAPPGATTDAAGTCIIATLACDDNDTAITTIQSCPNDAPSTKSSCSLCTLDGYTWCQDSSVEWDEYAGSCVASLSVHPTVHPLNEDGSEAAESSSSESSSESESGSESSGSESSESSSSDEGDEVPLPVTTAGQCPANGRSVTRLSDCGSFAAMGGGGKRHHGWKGWAFIVPIAVCLCITCCIRRRCKRRCREKCQQRRCGQWQQRCGQQTPGAAAGVSADANAASSPSSGCGSSGCGSYPGAVQLAVANAPNATVTVPIVVATPTTGSAPLLYSHDPQPTYVVPASVPVEVEMRTMASPTAVMYPNVNGNGYSRLTQSE